jgi:hypothetical protein
VSALLNPSRLGPRVKRELIEAVGVRWPVEWRRGIAPGEDADTFGTYCGELSWRRMRHVIFLRRDLCGPQLALSALHELVHAKQCERAGRLQSDPPRRPACVHRVVDRAAKPWLADREEMEAWRVSVRIMAELGVKRSLREWRAVQDSGEELLDGIAVLVARGLSDDEIAAELVTRGWAASEDEARIQLAIWETDSVVFEPMEEACEAARVEDRSRAVAGDPFGVMLRRGQLA